ncbi:MFS transporter [Parvibaculum sp.]|uniref:MFS transporter n=1 Tax=Parvibaculum sp. TaxID=2024848 RepID=UPI00391CF33F
MAKSALAQRGVSYDNRRLAPGEETRIAVGQTIIVSFDASNDAEGSRRAAFNAELTAALAEAGYPAFANPDEINYPMVVLILFILVLYATMVYGPIAAMLVELFPTRIRYTSMSLPYHLGNGWFGGFLPTVSFAIVAATGNLYSGLWYPIAIAAMTFVIGMIFVPETKDRELHPEGS